MTTRLGGAGFTHCNAITKVTTAAITAGATTDSCSLHAHRHFMATSSARRRLTTAHADAEDSAHAEARRGSSLEVPSGHRSTMILPLVLLPALLCDDELYRAQAADVADLADPIVLSSPAASLAEGARDVLRRAPDRFALAGTSAGGNLALEVVATAPARVAGLWLMGCNPGAHPDPDGAGRLS